MYGKDGVPHEGDAGNVEKGALGVKGDLKNQDCTGVLATKLPLKNRRENIKVGKQEQTWGEVRVRKWGTHLSGSRPWIICLPQPQGAIGS